MKILGITSLVLTALVGCAVSTDSTEVEPAGAAEAVDDAMEMEDVGTAEAELRLDQVDAVPVYFNHDNRFAVYDASWIYAKFDATVGKRIKLDVHAAPGTRKAPVAFKLYRVEKHGNLRLVKAAVSLRGKVVYTFKSQGTGAYVVRLFTAGRISDVVLRLSCNGDRCSPDPQPGEFCGGLAGVACDEGLYCDYAPEAMCGAADAGGACAVPRQACTKEYFPVCGCDDRTYGNACMASASGISVAHAGECAPPVAQVGESCGGFRMGPPPVCAEGLYCNYEIGDTCGWADAPGTCAERPDVCTQQYDPVCGCDGRTYSNACFAALHGAAVLREGACEDDRRD